MSRLKQAAVIAVSAAVVGLTCLSSIATQHTPSRYSTLVVEYVGEQDRLIDKVIITTSTGEGEWHKENLYSGSSLDFVDVFLIPKSTLDEITNLPLLDRELRTATRYEEVPHRPVNVRFVVGIGHDHEEVMLDAPTSAKILRDIAKRISSYPELENQIWEVLYATGSRK
jgi:hypothetical protein